MVMAVGAAEAAVCIIQKDLMTPPHGDSCTAIAVSCNRVVVDGIGGGDGGGGDGGGAR